MGSEHSLDFTEFAHKFVKTIPLLAIIIPRQIRSSLRRRLLGPLYRKRYNPFESRGRVQSMKGMPIRNTGKLITDCWLRAEQSLHETVRKKFHDRDEEIITELFHAELETEFAIVSEKGA